MPKEFRTLLFNESSHLDLDKPEAFNFLLDMQQDPRSVPAPKVGNASLVCIHGCPGDSSDHGLPLDWGYGGGDISMMNQLS